MRGDGSIYPRAGSPYWWMKYYLRGKPFRESTNIVIIEGPGAEISKREAHKVLRRRQREVGADIIGAREFITPRNERLTVNEILDELVADYELREKLTPQILSHLKPVRAALGDRLAPKLTKADVNKHIQAMRDRGKKKSTINRGTQLLGQAYRLARKRVGEGPEIMRLSESDNVRRGFLDRELFDQFVIHLPADLQDFARWGYITGWRKGMIAKLEWSMFDMRDLTMDVPGTITKNGEPIKLPLRGAFAELAEIIERRWTIRSYEQADGTTAISPFVFHREGLPVGDFKKAWHRATRTAGIEKVLFHDFRRSAVRNLRRAGVDDTSAMQITGHKTASVFRRYNIIDEHDLTTALEQLGSYFEKQKTEVRKVVAFAKSKGNEPAQ
jgi:integrase